MELTWKEVGESDGVNKGKVMVVASSKCAAGNCLRLGGSNTSLTGRSVYRSVPLTLVTSATLTFKYPRAGNLIHQWHGECAGFQG